MKRILLLLFIGCCGVVWAQTNTPAPARLQGQTNASTVKTNALQRTTVDADSAEFEMGGAHVSRKVIYSGNVRVIDPKVQLQCEHLTLELPPGNGHVNHMTAVTNVIIDFTDDNGEKYHVTSDKAVYDYNVVNQVTNETVTWTGHPFVTTKDGKTLQGEPLVWDRRGNFFYATHQTMVIPGGLNGGGTNNTGLKLY